MSPNSNPLPGELPSPVNSRVSTYGPCDKDSRAKSHSFYHSQPISGSVLYFCFNLGLTLYNKGVLIRFPFAYTLTALHALCGSIGGFVLLKLGVYVPAKLTDADNLALIAFSALYTINIAVSNLSLQQVTIPFHQVVRAATPIFTILLSMILFGTRSSRQKCASLIPVIIGVGFATYGDYYCTTSGFLLTVLGTLLAAIKTVYTNILQSSSSVSNPTPQVSPAFRYLIPPRLQLHPLDLLTRMAPLAFMQCVILAHMNGELERVRHWSSYEMTSWKAVALGLNGIIAFGLNVVSFTANKKAGPLSMTVAANVKQVLSIILAVLIFDVSISAVNATGILLTLGGGVWYARVEYQEKKARGRMR
ncbi:TPT-domain-containing protein [Melanogaster broomeanus]|nr:TPT-domain-containing protein [Melanogaster broomeanus]